MPTERLFWPPPNLGGFYTSPSRKRMALGRLKA